MAYSPLNRTKPDASDLGSLVPGTAKINDLALSDGILMGSMPGFVYSASGGTAAQPAAIYLKNGTVWLRGTLTWGTSGGALNNIIQIVWELSSNSGGSYDAIYTEGLSYDSNGNLTATTGGGGLTSLLLALLGKADRNYSFIVAHAALTGTAAHSLGSMSTQNANAVAITGGTAELATVREGFFDLGSINASTALDWAAGGVGTVTVTGASAVLTHSHLPNGKAGAITLLVTNGGLATNLFAGCYATDGVKPALKNSGKDVVTLLCCDGATVIVAGVKSNYLAI